jgi:peptidoglycan/LPS O-acetylase OafA/YrhL
VIEDVTGWLGGLSEGYGVDPLIYAILYVGSAPFFFGSLAWLIGRLRRRGSILLPALSTILFFSLPTLYVFVAGRNLPWWIYAVLVVLAVLGAIAAIRRVRAALQRSRAT